MSVETDRLLTVDVSSWLRSLQKSCPARICLQNTPDPAKVGRWLLLGALLCSLLAAQPAAAQETNPVCSDASGTLPNMIEGFIQLTTALGLMGLLVVWQADELAEMFTLGRERKRAIKEHKLGAMKSATVLVLLGPLFTVAGSVMELPIAQCVDLIPF